MKRWQLNIQLEIQGPVISQGVGAKHYGLDTCVARDHQGRVVLPGSLIKGNLRHALAELVQLNSSNNAHQLTLDWVQNWFGSEGIHDQRHSHRAKAIFDFNWLCENTQVSLNTLNRIKIDDSGVVETGALQFIETPFLPGQKLDFAGNITFSAKSVEAETFKHYLSKALEYISALGALKSVGFGKLLSSQNLLSEITPKTANKLNHKTQNRIRYTIAFDRPVCFAGQTGKGNRFVSQSHLSGAIIKGAIAHQILADDNYPLIHKYLDKIVMSFAYLVDNKNNHLRCLPIPLHMAIRDKQDQPVDVIDTPWSGGVADKFVSDFKSADFSMFDNKPLTPERSLMVKTAIESGVDELSRGAAKDGSLFSLECINHQIKQGNSYQAVHWAGYFELSDTAIATGDVKKLKKELGCLLAMPLYGLGKTKAIGHFDNISNDKISKLKSLKDGQRIKLTLNSPTRLITPQQLNACEDLFALYNDYFNNLCGTALRLTEHYTDETLAGGHYLWQHFSPTQTPYQASVVTVAGSTFVFEVNKGQAQQALAIIENLLIFGLESALEGADNPEQARWQIDPFDRANGFGEVSIELVRGN